MKFTAIRYLTGVTAPVPHDPRLIASALENPQCVGVVEEIDALNGWEALDIARDRFAQFQFTPSRRGRELCAQMLAATAGKGGAS